MTTGFYLVFDRHGDVRLTKRAPTIKPRERAAFLRVTVPDEAFAEPSIPHAHIDLTGARMLHPTVSITVESPEPQTSEDSDA